MKKWYQSRMIWFAILTGVAGIITAIYACVTSNRRDMSILPLAFLAYGLGAFVLPYIILGKLRGKKSDF
jgi:hypothetical protein